MNIFLFPMSTPSSSVFQPRQTWQQCSRSSFLPVHTCISISQYGIFKLKKKTEHHIHDASCVFYTSVTKPSASENRSPTGSAVKSDPGSPERNPPRGETKPEPAPRLRATSAATSPGGPVSPKPPVPQGTKPSLAARPTIPQKPRTNSSSKSIGTISWSPSTVNKSKPRWCQIRLFHFKSDRISVFSFFGTWNTYIPVSL